MKTLLWKQNTLKQIYTLWYTQIERCDMKIYLMIYNTLAYRYLFRFVCPTLVMNIGHPVRIQLTTQKNLPARQDNQAMCHFLRYLWWTFFGATLQQLTNLKYRSRVILIRTSFISFFMPCVHWWHAQSSPILCSWKLCL